MKEVKRSDECGRGLTAARLTQLDKRSILSVEVVLFQKTKFLFFFSYPVFSFSSFGHGKCTTLRKFISQLPFPSQQKISFVRTNIYVEDCI